MSFDSVQCCQALQPRSRVSPLVQTVNVKWGKVNSLKKHVFHVTSDENTMIQRLFLNCWDLGIFIEGYMLYPLKSMNLYVILFSLMLPGIAATIKGLTTCPECECEVGQGGIFEEARFLCHK